MGSKTKNKELIRISGLHKIMRELSDNKDLEVIIAVDGHFQPIGEIAVADAVLTDEQGRTRVTTVLYLSNQIIDDMDFMKEGRA